MPGDDKRSPGQRFVPPRAETWNNMVGAGDAHRDGLLSTGKPQPTPQRSTGVLKAKNSTGDSRRKGEILRLDGKAITKLSEEYTWLVGKTPDTSLCSFGVVKEPIADAKVAPVQVSGRCLALVDISSESHTHANPVGGSHVLASGYAGPIEILYAPSGTGELECSVRFGSPVQSAFVKIPDAGIAAATSDGATPSVTTCKKYIQGASGSLAIEKDDEDEDVEVDVLHYGAAIEGAGAHDFKFMRIDSTPGGWVVYVEYCNAS